MFRPPFSPPIFRTNVRISGKGWDASWRVESWPFEDSGVTVYSQAAAPHGPVALLVHGWGGHAGQMLALAEALGSQGMRPVIVEMPAHGRSPGAQSTLPQFTRAIEYVTARLRQQGHTVRALVAHSLGAAAASYVSSRGLGLERLVLIAPAASPPEYTRLFAQVFGLSETTRAAAWAIAGSSRTRRCWARLRSSSRSSSASAGWPSPRPSPRGRGSKTCLARALLIASLHFHKKEREDGNVRLDGEILRGAATRRRDRPR